MVFVCTLFFYVYFYVTIKRNETIMEVCRIIKVTELSDINFQSLGIHWTTQPEKATKHINPDNEPSLWLYAEIDESMIWNDYSVSDNSDYAGLESNGEKGEFEITLRPNTNINIIEIYDVDQNCIAENIEGTI